jgi:hypothetical protein
MGNRNGGIKNELSGKKNNDIKTHPTVARMMIDHLSPHFDLIPYPRILDACSGQDIVLGKAIKNKYESLGKKIESLDYQDREIDGKCILSFKPKKKFNIIIANPPWVPVNFALDVYNHLIDMLDYNGVLLFVVNNVFCYQGEERALQLFYQKYYFLPRYAYKWSGKKLLDAGVLVKHNDQKLSNRAVIQPPFIPINRRLVK